MLEKLVTKSVIFCPFQEAVFNESIIYLDALKLVKTRSTCKYWSINYILYF